MPTTPRSVTIPLVVTTLFIVAFAVAYRAIGVEKHFDLGEDQKGKPWFSSFYISCMALSNAMGDATPKTITGRSVFLAQVMTGFFILLLLNNVID